MLFQYKRYVRLPRKKNPSANIFPKNIFVFLGGEEVEEFCAVLAPASKYYLQCLLSFFVDRDKCDV